MTDEIAIRRLGGASSMDDRADDTALLAAVRAGDPAFADAFCRRVWPQVHRTVRRLVGPMDSERDDLAQLAAIELVRTISNYRGEASLDTWVTSVTAHVVYRHIRRKRKDRRVTLAVATADVIGGPNPSGEGALAARQVLSRILEHLSTMSPKLAMTFVLHDILGHNLQEAARIEGVTEAAAQSRLVRGRHQLHDLIAGDPELADLLDRLERRSG